MGYTVKIQKGRSVEDLCSHELFLFLYDIFVIIIN